MPNTSGLTWAAVTAPDPYLRGRSALTLFETHIQVAGDFGCWLWTRKLSRGYGSIYAAGETHRVHRFSYVVHRGPIPEGLTLDHLCRVTACVNPWHVEPVPNRINARRALGFRDGPRLAPTSRTQPGGRQVASEWATARA
jgi:hypothetical protein